MHLITGIVALIIVVSLVGIVISARNKRISKENFRRAAAKGLAEYKTLVEKWVKKVEATASDSDLYYFSDKEPVIEHIFLNEGGYHYRQRLRVWIQYDIKEFCKLNSRYQHAKKKVEGARKRLSSPALPAQKIYDNVKNASGADKLSYLYELLGYSSSGVLSDIGLTSYQVIVWIKQTYLGALDKARSGNREEFLQLRAFFATRKEYHLRKPIHGKPKDWAELVVRYLDNPDLSDFKEGNRWYSHEMPQKGELRLVAAEAIRIESLLQCQEVLAYCNYNSKFRKEVGDRLLAELAKLVDRLQAEARAKEVVT